MEMKNFDDFAYARMSEAKLPSLSIAIVKEDQIIHSVAFGLKNIEAAEPTTNKTNYGIGSITKSFTALGIAKLVEEGSLDFHDLVVKYLPRLAKYKAFEKVEIHHLLTHSSGIPALGSAEVLIYNAVGRTKKWFPTSTIDDLVSFFDQVDDWVVTDPGKKFFYLNEGYDLLGEIISKVSGIDYSKFIKKQILVPLEMNRCFFSKDEQEKDGDFATPYLMKEGKAEKSVIPWGSGAAGGLMSNSLDLSNYVQFFLNRGEFHGKPVIEKETLRKMETAFSKPPVSLFEDYGYGYGLFVANDFFGQKLLRHDGSVGVYTASMAYLPESKLGISILCNGEGYNLTLLSLYGLITMLGKDPEEFEPIKRERILRKLEGNYASYRGTVTAKVKRNGDFLILSGEDIGENIVLAPEKVDDKQATFYTMRSTAKLLVEFSVRGQSIEMIFERYRYLKGE
jgi:CubicO group peptidase (beta-lactamase class C family)